MKVHRKSNGWSSREISWLAEMHSRRSASSLRYCKKCLLLCLLGACVSALFLVACDKSKLKSSQSSKVQAKKTGSVNPQPADPKEGELAAGPMPFAIGQENQDDIIAKIRANRVQSIVPLGGTSSAAKMFMVGVTVIFKPSTVERPGSYRREVAAYRIARALGMDNVPPAAVNTYSKEMVQSKIHEDFNERWAKIANRWAWTDQGYVRGASMLWLDNLVASGIESAEARSVWEKWLLQDYTMPSESNRSLARDISTMLAFDYLIGNWDRFSGGNVKKDATVQRLFLLDHNASFGTPMHARVHRKVLERLNATQRFSKEWVERLLNLDQTRLKILMRDDYGPLLGDQQMADVFDRKETILSYIAALIAQYGRNNVLVFR